MHRRSKQYNWIQLCDLVFYSKYKNFNKLSIEFKSHVKLNSNHTWNWIQFHMWFDSKQTVRDKAGVD